MTNFELHRGVHQSLCALEGGGERERGGGGGGE
jgi:hypothetical protein